MLPGKTKPVPCSCTWLGDEGLLQEMSPQRSSPVSKEVIHIEYNLRQYEVTLLTSVLLPPLLRLKRLWKFLKASLQYLKWNVHVVTCILACACRALTAVSGHTIRLSSANSIISGMRYRLMFFNPRNVWNSFAYISTITWMKFDVTLTLKLLYKLILFETSYTATNSRLQLTLNKQHMVHIFFINVQVLNPMNAH